MKRLFFVVLMMITANAVNAQYCRICDENDEVISWKTWKLLTYDFSKCEENGELMYSKYRLSLSLYHCKHNKFSYIKLRVRDRAENYEWDNNREVCEMTSSQKKGHFWVEVSRRGNTMYFETQNCKCYISLTDYPNAWVDTKEILMKAEQAGLLDVKLLKPN